MRYVVEFWDVHNPSVSQASPHIIEAPNHNEAKTKAREWALSLKLGKMVKLIVKPRDSVGPVLNDEVYLPR